MPEAVYKCGQRAKCRVPYRLHKAPIEWAFDCIDCEVCRRWDDIFNERNFLDNIHDIIETRAGLSGFYGLFRRYLRLPLI